MDGLNHDSTTAVTSLKFKLPRKIFSDSSTSVPRKLRSAIRKRSCDGGSVSLPDAKRSNIRVNGVESLGRDSFKNSKLHGWSDHSSGQIKSLAISKDEEEVAETLFALAGLIPENKNISNEPFDGKSADFLRELYSNPTPSSKDTVILKEEPETTISSPNRLFERRQPNLNMEVSVSPSPFQIPPLRRVCDSTEQNRESMVHEHKPETYQLHNRESNINLGEAGDFAASEDKNNGFSMRPPAIFFPSWLSNTSSSISGSFKDALSASKVSFSMNGGRKSWKRCIAHVCISRVIQGLQTSEGKDIQPLNTSQMRSSQCPAAENKDNLTATLAAEHMFGPGAHKIQNCQVKEEGTSFSGCGDSKKQSYNFLSLSTGAGAEVANGVNRMGITLEGKGHVLQLRSVGQHNNTYLSCSMPQNHIPSIPYHDQAVVISGASSSMPPQVNLQLPPYFGNHCGPAHIGATTRSTQLPPSKQPIWTAQLAAQFRLEPFLSSHIANWQNATREAHSVNHIQSPRPSQETMGSKYVQVSQQPQEQLFGICESLPSMSSAKLQTGQLPSICEDKGG